MTESDRQATATAVIRREGVDALISALRARGYRVLGPSRRDDAIVYADIGGVEDLPVGWTDRQEAGRYYLERRADEALFGYAVGPHSWKRFLHPPAEVIWRAQRTDSGFTVVPPKPEREDKMAFLGVRACELTAMAIQDRVFIGGSFTDTAYQARRAASFVVAVNCGEAAETCFCVSMKAGPKVGRGFDLALTELMDADGQRYVVEVGSEDGAALLATLPCAVASCADIDAAEAVVRRTAGRMGRALETDGLKALLQGNPNHPRWDDVGQRCLSCANCTMVCPTCFCVALEDHTDLTGQTAARVRRWDSCFTGSFSYLHGGSVRTETRSRYRQWMTHKLASWIDQFGTPGCVGCGRCIAWCPVGIDITAEAAAMRAAAPETREAEHGRA